MKEEHSPGAPLHQKRHQGGVGLGRITVAAGEDQVVGPVVGCLASAGVNVVEGSSVFRDFTAAIGTDRSVLLDQPLTVVIHGATAKIASRTMRIRRGTFAGVTWHVVEIRQNFFYFFCSGYDQAA